MRTPPSGSPPWHGGTVWCFQIGFLPSIRRGGTPSAVATFIAFNWEAIKKPIDLSCVMQYLSETRDLHQEIPFFISPSNPSLEYEVRSLPGVFTGS